jgi:hypothetical protein
MQRKSAYSGIRQQCCWAGSNPLSASHSVPYPCHNPPTAMHASSSTSNVQHASVFVALQINGFVLQHAPLAHAEIA